MFTLVLGYSKAGKSRWAEKWAVRQAKGPLLYVATMIPVGEGEAGTATVERHRTQRAGLGFETMEVPHSLAALPVPQEATVLLEDVSNLLANYLFCEEVQGGIAEAKADVLALSGHVQNLVAVSFEGLEESHEYDAATNGYIRDLARLNEELRQAADAVVMLRQGEATVEKGVIPEF